jgi:hypothetical protein
VWSYWLSAAATLMLGACSAQHGGAAVSGSNALPTMQAPAAGQVSVAQAAGATAVIVDAGVAALDAAATGAGTHLDASRSVDGGTSASDANAAGDAEPMGTGAAAPIPQAGEIHGVNWADTRDNFVNGVLQLSGLDTKTDTYDSVASKTMQIAMQFRDKLGVNTIRIPINEPTVANAWWDKYKAVIDTTTGLGMNVIVAYWAYHNSKPDDEAAFKMMWQKVVPAYDQNNRVLFDIHNEPQGLGASWNDWAARWLGYFPALPRGRIIVAGTGVDDNVVPIGSDSRFAGCMLELHYYGYWYKDWTTQKQWTDGLKKALGAWASRTIVGEWGAPMSTGLNYSTTTPDGNNSTSYITATADFLRSNNMGSCYWPGLRDGDTYAVMKRETSGSGTNLSVVSMSGRDRLRWAWNL